MRSHRSPRSSPAACWRTPARRLDRLARLARFGGAGALALAVIALPLAVVASGCASLRTSGERYSAAGKHDLAALYYGAELRSRRDDPELRERLVAATQAALAAFDAEYDAAKRNGEALAALGVAARREELLDFVRSLGVPELDAVDAALLSREAYPAALAAAIAVVDKAETGGAEPTALLEQLRHALAFDPYSSELASRYERIRSRLQLFVALEPACDGDAAACATFLDTLTQALTAVRRELVVVVPWSSDVKTAGLSARLTVKTTDSGWEKSDEGVAKDKVERKNRFRETVKDHEGHPRQDEVEATYEVFRRTASASVSASVVVRDLGPSGAALFSAEASDAASDSAAYVTFTGDERALGDLAAIGTNQTPPAAPEALARRALQQLAADLARRILTQLEPRS